MTGQGGQEREHVFIRGESGTVRRHDLPLPWPIEDRLAKGTIHQVSDPDDASTLVAPEDSVLAPKLDEPKPESPEEVPGVRDEEPGGDEHTPAEPMARPAVNASKADWVRYALEQDQQLTEEAANALTKSELQKY